MKYIICPRSWVAFYRCTNVSTAFGRDVMSPGLSVLGSWHSSFIAEGLSPGICGGQRSFLKIAIGDESDRPQL